MNGIRELIDEEHKVRTCDVCKTQGKTEVEIKPSHDNADLCKECRQSTTGQEKADCCNERGAYEKEIQGQKCKYCWASSLKKKILDKRDKDTCGRCKGDMKKSKKKKKFFGHPICNKCVRSIPSPLKAYAAISHQNHFKKMNRNMSRLVTSASKRTFYFTSSSTRFDL